MDKEKISKLIGQGMSKEEAIDALEYQAEMDRETRFSEEDRRFQEYTFTQQKEALENMKEQQFLDTSIGKKIVNFITSLTGESPFIYSIDDESVLFGVLKGNKDGEFYFTYSSLLPNSGIDLKKAWIANMRHQVKRKRSLSSLYGVNREMVMSSVWKKDKSVFRLQQRLQGYLDHNHFEFKVDSIMDKLSPEVFKAVWNRIKDDPAYADIVTV